MPDQSSSAINDDLQLALRLADKASMIALGFFSGGTGSRLKADGTVVTDADLAVERTLCADLGVERPGDAILGEELGAAGQGRRRWILDPIDGTRNFVAGRPDWGVHIALEDQGEILVGVVTRPVLGRRWWAGRGSGAFVGRLDGKDVPTSLQVSQRDRVVDGRISGWLFDSDPLKVRLRSSCAWVEPDDLDTIMRVAEGNLDAVVDGTPSEIWDRAPLVVIIEEAGGRYRDRFGGRDLNRPGGLFTNGRIDDQLDDLLTF